MVGVQFLSSYVFAEKRMYVGAISHVPFIIDVVSQKTEASRCGGRAALAWPKHVPFTYGYVCRYIYVKDIRLGSERLCLAGL